MTYLSVNGVRYYVDDVGQGPPLVLLHGFTGSSQSWGTAGQLLGAHRRLLAIDLPGHGRTESPADPTRYAMDAVAADVIALLDKLGVQIADLLGYSMGGRLALYLALRYPDRWRSLILESASPGLATAAERAERAAADNSLADWIEAHGIAAFVERWEALPLFHSHLTLPSDIRAAQRERRLANNPVGLANSLRGMGTGQQPSLWAELDQLRLPVLLLAGALDEKFTVISRQMAERIPGARLDNLPDAGHTLHLEQPEAMTAAVLGSLRDHDQRAEQFPQTKQDHKGQRGQRHLLQPRIEGGQIGGPLNGQPVANQQRRGQQEQILPDTAAGGDYIDHGQNDGQEKQ